MADRAGLVELALRDIQVTSLRKIEQDMVGVQLVLCGRWLVAPVSLKSPEFYDHRKKKNVNIRKRFFPPPYPNGWIQITNAKDLENGNVKSISALGREFVAFRGKDGSIGVLDAYCPHLGAHLGQGELSLRYMILRAL